MGEQQDDHVYSIVRIPAIVIAQTGKPSIAISSGQFYPWNRSRWEVLPPSSKGTSSAGVTERRA